jgi:3-oxoacyl-[acyl-carrier protein] reductase
MNLSLKGKNALVCGSSKGIGKATAIEIAKLGANVTLVSRSPQIMSELIHELDKSQGQDHDFLVADFTQVDDLKKKVHGLVGAKHIHILVNNAGGPPAGPIVNAKMEDFLRAYNIHLICNHILVQSVIPGMKKDGYGRIINIISTSVKAPLKGLGVSNTTRGAVANWAKTMANELGPFGITVNNVLPGATNTGRLQEIIENKAKKSDQSTEEVAQSMKAAIPLGRFAQPSEIGAAAAFLASPAAAYITGTNITVDGGRTACL